MKSKKFSFKSSFARLFQQVPKAYSVSMSLVAALKSALALKGVAVDLNVSILAKTADKVRWRIGSNRRMLCLEKYWFMGERRCLCSSWPGVAINESGTINELQWWGDLFRREPAVPYTWSIKFASFICTASGLIRTIGPITLCQQWLQHFIHIKLTIASVHILNYPNILPSSIDVMIHAIKMCQSFSR